jgi:hypothetical protein
MRSDAFVKYSDSQIPGLLIAPRRGNTRDKILWKNVTKIIHIAGHIFQNLFKESKNKIHVAKEQAFCYMRVKTCGHTN